MLNSPIYNNTQAGRPPLSDSVVVRAITMSFGTNGSAVGQFNSIPFQVKEIRVLGAVFEDGGTPTESFAILWSDLFQTTPVALLGLSSTQLLAGTSNFLQVNGSVGNRIQFNPPRDISGQINFRLTDISAQQIPITLPDALCSACVMMEFVRGE